MLEGPRRASSFEIRGVGWLPGWEGRFPRGKPIVIVGKPGLGKSILTCHIAAELSKRGKHVLMSNLEDEVEDTIKPRLAAAEAHMDRVHLYTHRSFPSIPRDAEALRAHIKSHKAVLVIIDPASAHLDVSMSVAQKVRQAMTPIADIAQDTRCSFMLVTHPIKLIRPKSHPLDAIGGAGGGIDGAARAAFAFGANPTNRDERVLVPLKMNQGPMPKSMSFDFDGEEWVEDSQPITAGVVRKTAEDLDLNPLEVFSASQMLSTSARVLEAATQWLTKFLAEAPQTSTAVKTQGLNEGISNSTLRRASDQLEIVKMGATGPGKESVWSLPKGHPARRY